MAKIRTAATLPSRWELYRHIAQRATIPETTLLNKCAASASYADCFELRLPLPATNVPPSTTNAQAFARSFFAAPSFSLEQRFLGWLMHFQLIPKPLDANATGKSLLEESLGPNSCFCVVEARSSSSLENRATKPQQQQQNCSEVLLDSGNGLTLTWMRVAVDHNNKDDSSPSAAAVTHQFGSALPPSFPPLLLRATILPHVWYSKYLFAGAVHHHHQGLLLLQHGKKD